MTIRDVLLHPHSGLRDVAEPILEVNTDIQQLVKDLLETLYHEDGVGLAATQIHVKKRLLVLDTSDKRNNPQCFINPEIVEAEGGILATEGCLSFPGMFIPVSRPEFVKVRALDEHGELRTVEADGLLARCLQHEINHLDGVVFIDHITRMKRERSLKKYFKELELRKKRL
jgi:peptide deformylase